MQEHEHAPPHHVAARSRAADERTRVLRHGDAFVVLDHYGDINEGGLGEEGFYVDGTRFLSRWQMILAGDRPFLLSSSMSPDDVQFSISFANPEWPGPNGSVPLGTLYLQVRTMLVNDELHQHILAHNYGTQRVRASLAFRFACDFADMFEVRGMRRLRRGALLPPEVFADGVRIAYRGLDDVIRRSTFRFSPAPARISESEVAFEIDLAPRERWSEETTISCNHEDVIRYEEATRRASQTHGRHRAQTWMQSSNAFFDRWMERASNDVALMTTDLPTGPYPYAGIPWFNTPFGRDGIITALSTLWLNPSLSRGVLAFLASTQAVRDIPEEDAEPGKILHEMRSGEMARLKELPFGRYYGTCDATPLFVVLAGAYFQRTADREFLEYLWPYVVRAIEWIEGPGDRDGDGLLEYHRRSPGGLFNQGWKDSDDCISHADGRIAEGPIALAEVQAYAYGARRAAARMAGVLGWIDLAMDQEAKANRMRERFDQAFWSERLQSFALALDGEKRPCLVSSSNAGHCLFTGLAKPERAHALARRLLDAENFSGWGIRTLGAAEARFNPMGYHNGSIWPHDNALIASGFAEYGFDEAATAITAAMFDASLNFEMQRMPELFCGFDRVSGDGPVLYPVACSPQAWSAAAVHLSVQSMLGVRIDAPQRRIVLTRPRLLPSVRQLRLGPIELPSGAVDLELSREGNAVSVHVERRRGEVEVIVLP